MSLLDDAIKQHLELKRKHGASEDELRQLEDQAFGTGTRPGDEEPSPEAGGVFDEVAEAPTQFLGEAATDTAPPLDAGAELEETSVPEVEAAAAAEAAPEAEAFPEIAEADAEAPVTDAAPEPPLPVSDDAGDDPFEVPPYRLEDEAADEASAMEHEIAPPPDEVSEEPEALGGEAPAPAIPESPDAEAPEPPAPDEPPPPPLAESTGDSAPGALSAEEREEIASQPTQLYDFESEEGVDSAAADHAALEESNFEEETGEETFFDEQSLSDELDQALDAPADAGVAPALEPEVLDEEEEAEPPPPPPPPAQVETDEGEAESEGEDLLEGTPDFLQETPEGERLWFEQKPPKDFDFDD